MYLLLIVESATFSALRHDHHAEDPHPRLRRKVTRHELEMTPLERTDVMHAAALSAQAGHRD